jgi:methanethiol S-methyltransferase
MSGILAALYGAVCYLIFLGTFVYAVGFVGDIGVPKTIDSGIAASPLWSAVVDACLLTVFALQHSVMARPAFKRLWTRWIPKSIERSTYVLFASAALLLLYACWQPIPAVIWAVDNPTGALILQGIFWFGWAILLLATFLINHFELFGLSQVVARLTRRELPAPEFRTPFLYRYVRHPIYLGFILAFWAAPVMTVGHLLFAAAGTGYILVGIVLEERDLIAQFGDEYRRYRQKVSMLLPLPGRRL